MIDLSGRKAIVTGASRGIGYAVALAFARAGADVLAVARDEQALRALEQASGNGRITGFGADLALPQTADAVLRHAVERFGAVDVLVNNAGITRDGLLLRMSLDDWDAVMNLNLRAAFLLTQKVSRVMLKARKGAIVNVASIVGQIGNAGQANYTAAKAGLEAFTKSCAREFASRQIRVNAVAPGFIETAMTEQIQDKARDEFLAKIPLGRAGTPEEVAEVILFLASDHARYITGQVWRVDGGLVM
jgi:3-oxoacyl-[acyl-carrier protein] reductase